jgi:hypothetical protein
MRVGNVALEIGRDHDPSRTRSSALSSRTICLLTATWLSAVVFTGCRSPSATSATDIPLAPGPRFDPETTAAVIPPGSNPACPQGEVVVSRTAEGGIFRAPLGDPSAATPVDLRQPDPTFRFAAYDNQVLRLSDGELFVVWLAYTSAPLSPQPPWWNSRDPPGTRGELALWRSPDCGANWTPSAIDEADPAYFGGACAASAASSGAGAGDFDRPEAYVDPWKGTVYLTAQCSGTGAMVLLRSTDQGATWTTGLTLSSWEPLLMTSTPPSLALPFGRLFLFRCEYDRGPDDHGYGTYEPHLYWSDDRGASTAGDTSAYYRFRAPGQPAVAGSDVPPSDRCSQVPGTNASPVPPSPIGYTQPYVIPVAISRLSVQGGGTAVRAAFPAVTDCPYGGGCQVERLVHVNIDAAGVVSVIPVRTFAAEDASGSVLQATMVETDRIELPTTATTDTVTMYWLEIASPASAPRVYARYSLGRGGAWSSPADLSVTASGRISWAPNLGTGFAGDYMKGAFYFANGNLHFLCQWPESEDPSDPKGSLVIHYNVVSAPLQDTSP